MRSFFEILFQLEVFHTYFPVEEQHRCTALKFLPTGQCQRLLSDNRLVFKSSENGFVIVAEKRNIGTDATPNLVPFFSIPEGMSFHFFIVEEDNDFLNITDTDPALFADGKKYLFRNTPFQQAVVNGNDAVFDIHNNTPLAEAVTLAPVLLQAPVAIAQNPVRLVLRNAENEFVVEVAVPRDAFGAISATRLLISRQPLTEGVYTLQQINAAGNVVDEKRYFLCENVPGFRVNGIVAITNYPTLRAQENRHSHFVVSLQPRRAHWVYHIDIERYEDPAEFSTKRVLPTDLVIDASQSTPAVGTTFARTIVQTSSLPQEWFINDKVRFRSNNPIPLQKETYERVSLHNNSLAPPTIIRSLPNPPPLALRKTGPNRYEADIYLKVK